MSPDEAQSELHRQRVLQAFMSTSRLDVDELLDLTGIEEGALSVTLTRLTADRVLKRVGSVYYRTVVEAHVPQHVGADAKHLPLLLGLTEDEALNRIRMLGRMKARLITDWHPIIDKLMGDYVKGLEIVESLRYGATGSDEVHSAEK